MGEKNADGIQQRNQFVGLFSDRELRKLLSFMRIRNKFSTVRDENIRHYFETLQPKRLARAVYGELIGGPLSIRDWTQSFHEIFERIHVLRALLAGYRNTNDEELALFRRLFPIPAYPEKKLLVYNCLELERGVESFEVKKHAWDRFHIRYIGANYPLVRNKGEDIRDWQQFVSDNLMTTFARAILMADEEKKRLRVRDMERGERYLRDKESYMVFVVMKDATDIIKTILIM